MSQHAFQNLRHMTMNTSRYFRGNGYESDPPSSNTSNDMRKTVLQDRLQEMVIFELHENGNREYYNLTLRQLYSHVMKAITQKPCFGSSRDLSGSDRNVGSRYQYGSFRSSPSLHPETVPSHALPPPLTTVPEESERSTSTVPSVSEPSPSNQQPSENHPLTEQPPTTDDDESEDTPHVTFDPSISNLPEEADDSLSSLPLTFTSFRRQRQRTPSFSGQSDQNSTTPTYRERLGGYLHPRDMRRLVTPFSSTNEPELIVRRHVMLLNFDPLRAIVLRDRLLVLVPDGADKLLMELERRVRGGISELENQVFGDELSMRSVRSSVATIDSTEKKDDGSKKRMWRRKGKDTAVMANQLEDKLTSSTETSENDSDRQSIPEEDTEESNDNQDDLSENNENDEEYMDFLDEWNDIDTMKWTEISFELDAVDGVLQSVCSMLSTAASKVSTEAFCEMSRLKGQECNNKKKTPINLSQERLKILKDKIGEMDKRVKGFVRAMNLVLDDDEDMALMNLSRLITHPERFIQPVQQEILSEESDEPELILEAYLQQALCIVNALDLLKTQITNTEEQVQMKLDTVRNKLLFVNTVLSFVSICVSTGSFVGSLFGMNLINHLEDDDTAFIKVVVGTVVPCFLILVILIYYFQRTMDI